MITAKSFFLALVIGVASLLAGRGAESASVTYQLIDGSFLLDDCPICGRPSIELPMRGSFQLRLLESGPFNTRYAIEKIDFHAGGPDNNYGFKGSGTLDVSSAFAVLQYVSIEGTMSAPFGTNQAYFTNQSPQFTRALPMIAVRMLQTNGTLAHTFTMQIYGAPFQEIWFSTGSSFHGADLPIGDNEVSSGDLLSSGGWIVKRNSELQEKFPGPTFANMNLDAADLQPGAEIAFSTDTLGVLNDGDYALASSGEIFRYTDFLGVFGPIPSDDPGLDGLQLKTNLVYYSLEKDMESWQAGVTLQHGDLLSVDLETVEAGVFRKNGDLLAQFSPVDFKTDYGLDAFYVWPSGEIWFSTRDGFTAKNLGAIGPGDLLSDRGYVVYRNLELVSRFKPIEDASNFGLDAVTLITDVDVVEEPATLKISFEPVNSGTVKLAWTGRGKVFQVERAFSVEGPYSPVSSIISDLRWEEPAIDPNKARYFRLRQW